MSCSSPSIATVAPWRAATARSVSAKATSGWNDPICVPAAIAGARTAASRRRWCGPSPGRCTSGGPPATADRVVRDRDDDQLDLVEERRRLGKRAAAVDQALEPLAPRRVAAGDGLDRPAGPVEGDAEGRADGTGADDPDDRRVGALRPDVRVGVVVGVDLVAVPVLARRDRVEVDSGCLELLDRLVAQAVPVRASPSPRGSPRPSSAAGPGGPPRAVLFHATSVPSVETEDACPTTTTSRTRSAPARASDPGSPTTTG